MIRPERAGDPRALGRFEHEVRATARLSDPNIVEVYDYGRAEDGTFFYVMEYLHGLNLDDLVERHGPMPPGRVIYLLRQACLALAEAHGAGLIHRDLKPANIVAARRGRRHDFVKLLDFGLVELTGARHEPGPTRERTVGGTPQYMAPEQITRRPRARPTLRPVRAGRRGVYPSDGPASVRGRDRDPGDERPRPRSGRAPVPPPCRHPLGPRAGRAPMPGEGPRRAIPSAEELETALSACASVHEWDARKAAALVGDV